MRLVQISSAHSGAQKTIAEAIHHYVVEQGHESYILYGTGCSDEENIIRYENRLENSLTRGLRKYIGKYPVFSVLQTLRLLRYIERAKPDVVHLHVIHHGYMDYEMLLRYLGKKDIPVVYTMHDMWAFTGGCYYYTTAKCDGYANGCMNCPLRTAELDVSHNYTAYAWRKKRDLLAAIQQLHFVTVSQWVQNEMQRGFLAKRPVTVIPNGVYEEGDEFVYGKGMEKSTSNVRIICVASSWNKRKGIDMLLELAALLGEGFEILLVGGVSEQIKASAPSNVRFYGYCADRRELKGLYASSDIHLSASCEETFGMTFIEAALVGVRCIGFASTAIRETIQATGGIAVEEYTAHALYNAVRQLVDTSACRLTAEEIAVVKERYSTKRMAQEYAALYKGMLNQ